MHQMRRTTSKARNPHFRYQINKLGHLETRVDRGIFENIHLNGRLYAHISLLLPWVMTRSTKSICHGEPHQMVS